MDCGVGVHVDISTHWQEGVNRMLYINVRIGEPNCLRCPARVCCAW